MLKHRRENRLALVLDCFGCGRRVRSQEFSVQGEEAVCRLCSVRNPLANVIQVTKEELTSRRIHLCFIPRDGYQVHALHLDCRTVLSPWRHVSSLETLERLLRYLGATEREMAVFVQHARSWGQGSVKITLRPGRKNLLGLAQAHRTP